MKRIKMRLEEGVRFGKTYKKVAGRAIRPWASFSAVCWGFCGKIHQPQPQMNLRVADSRGPMTPGHLHTHHALSEWFICLLKSLSPLPTFGQITNISD